MSVLKDALRPRLKPSSSGGGRVHHFSRLL